MKIKAKKPFGQKHQLRLQKLLDNNKKLLEDNKKLFEDKREFLERKREFLESKSWYQRILSLCPDDPCEFYERRAWHTAIFVQRVKSEDQPESWKVRDAQGKRLRAFYIRAPGDQEAWPGLDGRDLARLYRLHEIKMARLGVRIPVRPDVVQDPDPNKDA